MSNSAPPLNLDLASVDTSLPLIADGIYDFRVEKAEIKETNAKDGKYINLDLVTVAPSKSVKGEDLGPGVHVFDSVMMNPTGKGTWEMVNRNLAMLVQAAAFPPGTARRDNIPEWAQQLTGRTLRISIGFVPAGISQKNGKPYRAKNEVVLYIKK